jgi:hypothetical protein
MKTSLDIPDDELRDVVRFTEAKTKREAIITAVADYNRRKRAEKLLRHFGTFDSVMTNEEIEALEEREKGGHTARKRNYPSRIAYAGYSTPIKWLMKLVNTSC